MKKLILAAILASGIAGVGFAAQAHRPEVRTATQPGCEQTDDWKACFWKQMQQNGGGE